LLASAVVQPFLTRLSDTMIIRLETNRPHLSFLEKLRSIDWIGVGLFTGSFCSFLIGLTWTGSRQKAEKVKLAAGDARVDEFGTTIDDDFATLRDSYGTVVPLSSPAQQSADGVSQLRPDTPSSWHQGS
jgi:hypothetical protein